MRITLEESSNTPIYRQLVDRISAAINSRELAAGSRLPTVRELAEETGAAHGTVKHAYDVLEGMGLIEMTQGRGTFVKERPPRPSGRKDQAMQAIDALLDEMARLGFTIGETRIFFELKLREREERYDRVRVCVVDCNPEAMLSVQNQLSGKPCIDITCFLLDDVLQSPGKLDNGFDLIVTTAKHYGELEPKAPYGSRVMRMVLTTSPETVFEMAKVDSNARVGIVAASRRFTALMLRGCQSFCTLANPPATFLLGGGEEIGPFLADKDVLILPPGYLEFCGPSEEKAITAFAATGKGVIRYDYHIDRGSLLYLDEQIQAIRAK